MILFTNVSADITEKEFYKLLAPSALFAITNSKYDKPENTPYIILVDQIAINQVIGCNPKCNTDDVSGYYDNNTKSIYIDKRVLTIHRDFAMGLLIHEFVHFLQFQNEAHLDNCEIRKELETEAISIQFRFLRSRGKSSHLGNIKFKC